MSPAAETTPRAVEKPASQVIWTAYGAPAYDVLRNQVASIQRHDPLAVVTVVVPSNLCGIVLRRHLAATALPDGRPGVAGLSVLTLDRVGELLAASTLTARGLRPATGPVRRRRGARNWTCLPGCSPPWPSIPRPSPPWSMRIACSAN